MRDTPASRVAARISLKTYSRLLLSATRYVPVPSTRDINLPIDEIFVTLNLENAGLSQRVVTHATLFEHAESEYFLQNIPPMFITVFQKVQPLNGRERRAAQPARFSVSAHGSA